MVSKLPTPGSLSLGMSYQQITVESIDQKSGVAVCKNKLGHYINVNMKYMPAKGPLPLINEAWLIDRQYGVWSFALALKWDLPIMIHKFVETFSFVALGSHSWQITHNLNTINHTFNIYNAAHVNQTIFSVTVGLNMDTVSTVDPPPVTTYTFVAIG